MVYIVDPYHIFHETRWNKNLWFGSQTLINLGQIESCLKRTKNYDGILVGSSHGMNFNGSELAKAVGAKGVLKLCSASQEVELSCALLKQSIDTHKVRKGFVLFDYLLTYDSKLFLKVKRYMRYPWLCLFDPEHWLSLGDDYIISHGLGGG